MTPALDRFARVMMGKDTQGRWVWDTNCQSLLKEYKAGWLNGIRAALLDMAENPSEAVVEAGLRVRVRQVFPCHISTDPLARILDEVERGDA